MVAITSGSNINFERLRLVAELAELGSNAEHMLASTISGAPGSLQAFLETATANKENITELRHRCVAVMAKQSQPTKITPLSLILSKWLHALVDTTTANKENIIELRHR